MINTDWLKYRAKEGILKVHLDADGGRGAFSEIVTEAIRYSENEQGEYCFMDTFLSDSIEAAAFEQIFKNAGDTNVKILLVDPNSYFGRHRAKALRGSESFRRTITGLERIAEALKLDNKLFARSVQEAKNLTYIVDQIEGNAPVEIRFYDNIISGPIYFFRNIVLSGQYSTTKSAIYYPWLMIVNDANQDGDFFDELRKEFDAVWHSAYQKRVEE